MRFRALVVPAMLALSVFNAQASDEAARGLYTQAQASFEGRQNLEKAKETVTLADQALAQAEDAELRYDILILKARAQYWLGSKAKSDKEKMAIYEKAMDSAEAAKKLFDDYAEGYYYYGISLGKWALAKGVIASLSKKQELIDNAEGAMERITRAGEPGVTIDGYGPNRTLGRMYFKLPGFAGGSLEKSLKYLEEAVNNASDNALNTVYYAESLYNGNGAQKALARKLLDELLAKDANTFNPSRVPETLDEFEEGRQLRKEMGNK